jgi:hypothetical protein
MPLASPLVSPKLVKRRFGSAAWPPNETAKLVQRALEIFCGYDRRSRSPNETAVATLLLSGAIRRLVAAEWNSRSSPASLGSHSAVTFCGLAAEWNRRSASFKGNHVFSHSQFLASINTSFSLVLIITLIIKNPIFTREKKQIRLPFYTLKSIPNCIIFRILSSILI